MSGDYSRFTFDPLRRFASVRVQQGRVQLDSDWNEHSDVLRERTRLLGLDSGGPAWLPTLTTPDAFLIGAIAGPPADLSIQDGRIYVDGRLAEIFSNEGVTYLKQPFLPDPPAPDPTIDTLVYLDLWEREVTWVEELKLLDTALGGVDTTTRIQQVWQVKLYKQPGAPAVCGVDLNALFAPSAGRLTTSAVAPPAPDDPCILPLNAGYRGIENRLYRVEIQTPGPLGTALFKWSRDNGSIASRVTSIAVAGGQTRLSVNRVGRDARLRLRINDWVTLTDDHRELWGEAGQMARVIDIDEAKRIIVLDRAVPTAGRAFGATAVDVVARNTRLQRWDESAPLNVINGDGLMATAAGPIDLEDGVQVSFTTATAGGQFKVGDYWVFAARTANAWVEPLNAAPPRGIHHQYLQLAAIPANGAPTDCRPIQIDDAGCCTFVVRPGEDIQAAIDKLPKVGGCVCLKAGLHPIDRPLILQRDNLCLHGESMGAMVFNRRGTGVIVVSGANHVHIHTLVLRQGEASSDPIIVIKGTEDLIIDECRLETFARPGSVGILAFDAANITVSACIFDKAAIGVWFDEGSRDVVVTDCEITLPDPDTNRKTTVGIMARTMRGSVTAENNTIVNAVNGILINDQPNDMPVSRANFSRIAGNRIELAENKFPDRSFGIDVASPQTIVSNNQLVHDGSNLTAIRLCGNGSTAMGNIVVCRREAPDIALAIVVGNIGPAGAVLPLERMIVADNIIEGGQHGILMIGAVRSAIRGNVMGQGSVRFGFATTLVQVADTLISENIVYQAMIGIFATQGARNLIRDNRIEAGQVGIFMHEEAAPTLHGNHLTDLERLGLLVFQSTERCDITSNRVIRCGTRTGLALGIAAIAIFGELNVQGNEVMDTGVAATGGGISPLAFGITGFTVLECRIDSNLVTYSRPGSRPPTNEDRALLLQGMIEYEIKLPAGSTVFGFPVQITNNKFIGTGATALVELRQTVFANVKARFERVMFSGNYCSHFSLPFNDQRAATVSMAGRLCTVSGNQVKAATPDFRSYDLHGMPGPFIGNISHGPTWDRLNSASWFPNPEFNYNLKA
ncbi:DUF6519 domain-containing protein [Pseudomonas sp. BE134]|uniref:DUF6519 domain-containing protein n=1 Tax=Pseudomonas sp. BE134 TaxID=2817843 RepID=UPI00285C8711|nr:DUF6519 domain-containing protein [Pseudomonas sp. BE134]MDR6929371.1 hypothetical protein [Pseudomonas sp. BE134]